MVIARGRVGPGANVGDESFATQQLLQLAANVGGRGFQTRQPRKHLSRKELNVRELREEKSTRLLHVALFLAHENFDGLGEARAAALCGSKAAKPSSHVSFELRVDASIHLLGVLCD